MLCSGDCTACTCFDTNNKTCVMEVDGLPTCLACRTGYSGRHCQVCADGFFGDPLNVSIY